MMFPLSRHGSMAFFLVVISASSVSPLSAQTLPDVVVTATRSPTAISDSGTAISIIPAETLAKTSPKDISNVLRMIPGLDVTQTGGPGSETSVRLRGASSQNTLVLIDGVRINDPASASGGFDFSSMIPTDIERIEVLRGPQSALYGSDAMGGVINIITRRGLGKPRVTISAEAGRYGSRGGNANISGRKGSVSYAFSISGYGAEGFSRYGYRIKRIEERFPYGLENDPFYKLGTGGRITIDLNDTTELEFSGYSSLNIADFDAGWGTYPDTPSRSRQALFNGSIRLKNLMLNGHLTNRFTLSGNSTDRTYRMINYDSQTTDMSGMSWVKDYYRGNRVAADYQGDLKLDAFGVFTFGAKAEKESAQTYNRNVFPVPSPRTKTSDTSQITHSAYAIHQISPIKNLHLSLGGRIDAIESSNKFNTWRATAAYKVDATGTTMRSSFGTGAKAPTLYQLYDPSYGNPNLRPERSNGFDIGIDQKLFDARISLSATYFFNRFSNMINFVSSPSCPPAGFWGCYVNVSKARTHGVELSGSFDVIPDNVQINAVYTYLNAIDAETNLKLARRPEHVGRFGLAFKPFSQLTIEPSIVFVGKRYSSNEETDKLASYARIDARIDYKIDETMTAFLRVENLADSRYQDVKDYGTAGRSFYGGLRVTW